MDDLVAKGIGVAVGLLAGAALKHETPVNHKALGLPVQYGVAQATAHAMAAMPDGVAPPPQSPEDLFVLTQMIYLGLKSAWHGGKEVVRGAKAIGRLLRRVF